MSVWYFSHDELDDLESMLININIYTIIVIICIYIVILYIFFSLY